MMNERDDDSKGKAQDEARRDPGQPAAEARGKQTGKAGSTPSPEAGADAPEPESADGPNAEEAARGDEGTPATGRESAFKDSGSFFRDRVARTLADQGFNLREDGTWGPSEASAAGAEAQAEGADAAPSDAAPAVPAEKADDADTAAAAPTSAARSGDDAPAASAGSAARDEPPKTEAAPAVPAADESSPPAAEEATDGAVASAPKAESAPRTDQGSAPSEESPVSPASSEPDDAARADSAGADDAVPGADRTVEQPRSWFTPRVASQGPAAGGPAAAAASADSGEDASASAGPSEPSSETESTLPHPPAAPSAPPAGGTAPAGRREAPSDPPPTGSASESSATGADEATAADTPAHAPAAPADSKSPASPAPPTPGSSSAAVDEDGPRLPRWGDDTARGGGAAARPQQSPYTTPGGPGAGDRPATSGVSSSVGGTAETPPPEQPGKPAERSAPDSAPTTGAAASGPGPGGRAGGAAGSAAAAAAAGSAAAAAEGSGGAAGSGAEPTGPSGSGNAASGPGYGPASGSGNAASGPGYGPASGSASGSDFAGPPSGHSPSGPSGPSDPSRPPGPGGPTPPGGTGGGSRPKTRKPLWWRMTRASLIAFAACAVLVLGGFGVAYAVIQVPDVAKEAAVNQGSTFYYADGETQFAERGVDREPVDYKQIPDQVQEAVISAEDRGYWDSPGVSVTGTVRAVWFTVTGKQVQGGSTITQQFVRNYFEGISREQTITRKLKEIIIALKVDQSPDMDKQWVMEQYLNTIYFGRNAYGIQSAAQAYYHKDVGDLTSSESAFLAAAIQQPSLYGQADSNTTPQMEERWQYVVDGMVEGGAVSQAEADKMEFPAPKAERPANSVDLSGYKGYMLQQAMKELKDLGYSEDNINRGGYKVVTTFDQQTMELAKSAVEDTVDVGSLPEGVQAGLTAVEPSTGEVVGFYGGHDYMENQYDSAFNGSAQAGSAFKPYVLATALEQGYSLNSQVNGNSPIQVGGSSISNYDHTSHGPTSLIEATRMSLNTGYVQLAQEVGPENVRQTANDVGIPKSMIQDDQAVPAIALGVSNVRPVDQASGFATFANGGEHVETHVIREIVNKEGENERPEPETSQAISQESAANVSYALQQVVQSGTGTSAALPDGRPVAGKTGTTDGSVAAWFAGYTPQLSGAVGVYNGNNQPFSVPGWGALSGGTLPAAIWNTFMTQAMEGKEVEQFPEPTFGGEVHDLAPDPPPSPEETAPAEPSTPATRPEEPADPGTEAPEDPEVPTGSPPETAPEEPSTPPFDPGLPDDSGGEGEAADGM
ncbi:transglycosylase domain-containing protein [Streptomonospora wellingtoniae]|uniref:Transglycosylase domain-containing protein n=1 Tax=Streptomonospora wellingtoniae TaxID=3075544 RepID=A0ABU2KSV1_9ACTN|nr:transglycosylase domain-containing protein [Streptomonospora sp. DSM 45055]MDT0302352.1 transglycosylase domain-containing protein [Streptomonospora sp. DSM 45055]